MIATNVAARIDLAKAKLKFFYQLSSLKFSGPSDALRDELELAVKVLRNSGLT